MSENTLKPFAGSSDNVIDQLIEKDIGEELGSSDYELDLTESSQPDELPDILTPVTDSTQPEEIPDILSDSTQPDELPDIYPSDESYNVEPDDIVEVDHALRRIELDHSKVIQGLTEYESPIEELDNDDRVVISDDSADEPDQHVEHPNLETGYVQTDNFVTKITGRKRRKFRIIPFDTKLTVKKGKQLVSGKSTTKSSTLTLDQLVSETSKFPHPALLDSGFNVTDPLAFQQPALSDSGFIDDGASSKLSSVLMFCDSCNSKQSHNSVVQCCDGHVLCAQCVEKSTKLVLIGEKKGAVGCPLQPCTSSIPDSELRKSLPAIVLDLLEEKWKKDTLEALENMKDAVKCPGCGFSAVLDVGIRKFPCSNCGKAFCRVCDKHWEEKDNHDICYRTKQWTSSDNGSVQQIPEHWSYSNGLEIEPVVELSDESEEFFNISSLIYKDMPVNVLKVYRIQSIRLWEKYSLTKRHMLDDLGDVGINEKRLFHGTDGNVVEAICKEGFDWRLCGKHGTVFGKGSYFAKSAVMSDRYSSGKESRRSKNVYQVTARSRPTASALPNSGVLYFGASNINSTPRGLRFVASTTSTNSTPGGLRFGAPTASTNSTSGGLRFGAPTASTNSTSGGLRFGAPTASTNSTSGGLRFGAPTASTNSTPGGLQFGAQSTNSTSGGLRFGAPTTSTNSNPGGLQFGAQSTNSNSGGLQFGAQSTNSNPGGLQFGAQSTNSNPGGLQFGAQSTNSNSGGFQFGAQSTNSNTGGFPFGVFSFNSAECFGGPSTNSNSGAFGHGALSQLVGAASSSTSCLMFVSRVLVGRPCLGNGNMKRPEKNRNGESTHSAVNDLNNPTIHVIFDSSQCYPEYLIQYSPYS